MALPAERADARYVLFGHYQLGRAHQLEGSRDEARKSFERVLALPDEHDAHRRAREALDELSGEGGTR